MSDDENDQAATKDAFEVLHIHFRPFYLALNGHTSVSAAGSLQMALGAGSKGC
jgi:hypothetical protein